MLRYRLLLLGLDTVVIVAATVVGYRVRFGWSGAFRRIRSRLIRRKGGET